MQDFITTQLYSDQKWEHFLAHTDAGFEKYNGEATYAERLRQAVLQGMDEEVKEIDQIVANPEAPTFANTIMALSDCGETLSRATSVLYNLLSAETNDDLDALATELSPKLSEHESNIMLNEGLFAKIKAVYEKERDALTGEDKMLLEKVYTNFERSGANLPADKKQRFREITSKLSDATLKFSQNLLKETNNFFLHLTEEEALEGLPELHRQTAAHEAKNRGLEGWVFTLHAPSYGPFMMYSAKRAYREKMYRAYNERCTHDNEQNNFSVVREIVDLRQELARILGYKHYAEYALKRRMAQDTANVYNFLDEVLDHYLEFGKADVAQVEAKAKQMEGDDFRLMPWDFSYYSQKLKQELYDYDPDMLRPYFELEQVKKGVLGLATKLYGITFSLDKSIPVYHKDVSAYRVLEADGTFLGTLLLDFFPRAGKKGGAWMTDYRGERGKEYVDNQTKVTPLNSYRPVISVTTNFTKPTADRPALLTLGEVETFLHEFGHSLHGLFAMTRHGALSGTSVYWDFVELPSQFMENYATESEFLSTFARHYQTGEPLPESYIERIKSSRHFLAAYGRMRQVSFCLLDMAYYTQTSETPHDVKAFEAKAWERAQLLPRVPEACMSVQFGHIMSGGYAAGYYSYQWAEVLDADAFAFFKEKGIFNSEVAASFRECILSKGGTEQPMTLYKRFRGKEPDIKALLERDGLK